jgi:hypothetical protein
MAELLHDDSIGHARQFVASPAAIGFLARLKLRSEPLEVILLGKCGGSLAPELGEQRSQRRKSMS